MSKQDGFTLIEIMIVTAIISILAAVAISQYQIYVAKTQTTRIISELSQLRTTVEECLASGRVVIGLGLNQCDPRATGSTLVIGGSQVRVSLPSNTGVAQISDPLTLTSDITATVSTHVNPELAGKKIQWIRTNAGSWSCSSSVEAIYLPTYCLHDASL